MFRHALAVNVDQQFTRARGATASLLRADPTVVAALGFVLAKVVPVWFSWRWGVALELFAAHMITNAEHRSHGNDAFGGQSKHGGASQRPVLQCICSELA
jgi:hypothetical protein